MRAWRTLAGSAPSALMRWAKAMVAMGKIDVAAIERAQRSKQT
ncbi:hypothetical protein [Hydrogenophaga sp.]|nr:hypothetical protein [Hydrogenophaga sp.]